MKNKLILVEGLPGVGKTTISKTIKQIFHKQNIKSKLFLEGEIDQPADYESVAFFNEKEYEEIIKKHPENSEIIKKITQKNKKGYLLNYKEEIDYFIREENKNIFEKIKEKDIYELPLELHQELILEKWDEFSKKIKNEDEVYIIECCFIQNPITYSFIREGESEQNFLKYIKKIEDKIISSNPLLIYVEQDDYEKSFKKIVEERPTEWKNFFIDYYTNQGYGKESNKKDLKGAIEVLKKRQKIEQKILNDLKIKYKVINNTNYSISKTEKMLEKLILNSNKITKND
ncbi:hypothetical protein [Geotoga petraea]|uniref:Uncharacterized protein n=1 Tax=Geotoga petraea TaxID=28234 RepID=A0A1G6NRG7_9BACT|nr:hypothetical protein [Geotoga petraea]SDC69944.1 hypothetical protein SAMN04488588_1621 [Geotoga petraea]